MSNQLKSIIEQINKGESVKIGSKTKVVGVNIINAAGNIDAPEMNRAFKPHATALNPEHKTVHPESGLLQLSCRYFYVLDREVSITEAKYIEEELANQILNRFKNIDIHGGSIRGISSEKVIEPAMPNTALQYTSGGPEPLNADEYALQRKTEEELKAFVEATTEMTKTNSATPEELIDMAKYIQTKEIEVKEFEKMAAGIWNSQLDGEYDEETAIEILRTVDTKWHEDSYYEEFKPAKAYESRRNTIASFIWFATKQGYKRGYTERYYVAEEATVDIPTETIEIEQYINSDDIYAMLKSDERTILIDSPTGSGKTTASFPAIRRMLDEDENLYAIFAVPTKALAIQTSTEREAGTPLRGRRNVAKVMKDNAEQTGHKLVVSTYDKVPLVMKEIEKVENAKVIIVADEVHKEVVDYSYRKRAIKGLFDLREHPQLHTFIGLSGTPQVIDKGAYDAMKVYRQKNAKPIFNELHVLEYNRSNDFTKVTAELIAKEYKEGRKVLAFVIRKAIIEEVKQILGGMGIKAATIMNKPGNEEKSKTYRRLMDDQAFPKGVDVVLATNAIADGINILNDDENYTCIIAPHRQQSRVFELSTIKQMSNRFRHQYDRLIVPIFIKEGLEKERREQTALYGVEDRYDVLTEKAEKVSSFVKERFGGRLDEYSPSVLETMNGMFYINSHRDDDGDAFGNQTRFIREALAVERHLAENPKKQLNRREYEMIEKLDHIREHLFSYDERTLRLNALQDSEEYYSLHPYAFTRGMEWILKADAKESTVANYIEGLDKSISQEIQAHLNEIEEIKEETEKEKHERIDEVLTEKVFEALKKDYFKRGKRVLEDSEAWVQLSEVMTKEDMQIVKDVLPFTNHTDAIRIAKSAGKTTNKYGFKRSLKTLNELEGESATTIIAKELKRRIDNAEYQTAGGNECLITDQIADIHKELAIELKESKKTIEAVHDKFILNDKKRGKVVIEGEDKKKVRQTLFNFRFINLQDIGKQYGINEEDMDYIYKVFKREMYEGAAA